MHSGDQSRWWSERTWNSSPDKNMSKIHIPVEQFLPKTNWKLGEGLLYHQGCKEDAYLIGQDGKESIVHTGLSVCA